MSAKKVSVRLMAPFSMQCTGCSHFIYKSTKFNARKRSTGDAYLGISIIQLSFRCPSCSGEIILKTDPKAGDYIIERGASRNLDGHEQVSSSIRRERPTASDSGKLIETARQAHTHSKAHIAVFDQGSASTAAVLDDLGLGSRNRADSPEPSSRGGVRKKQLPTPKRRKHLSKVQPGQTPN